MAVTTALCADQVTRAAPASRPQMSELAGRIVQRLTLSFRRTVVDVAPVCAERRVTERCSRERREVVESVCLPHRPVTPFQFRLPPPALA
jgi:hypothetical protein